MTTAEIPQTELSSPYPGLRPFQSEEAEIFFGRDQHVDQLLAKLQTTHFLAVVGVSGCGKSSLVRAGMIPALRTGLIGSAGGRWRIVELRPGDQPRARLAAALTREAILGVDIQDETGTRALVEATLRKGPLGLVELLRESPPPPHTNILLFIDQFEEIFRYRATASVDEAEAFIALLLASAASREFPVYVAIAMRSDFLGECALFNGLPEAINESQYLTPRLTRDQIWEAIVRPARLFGGDIEPTLVNRLLNEIGPDPDQLPVLQHALMRMWESAKARDDGSRGPVAMSDVDYGTVGSLKSALNDHAEQVFRSLGDCTDPATEAPDTGRYRTARVIFQQLTERAIGRRDTRRPAQRAEMAAVAGVAPEEIDVIVQRFRRSDNCFLAPASASADSAADELIDIAHESLIRKWTRLSRWVALEAESAVTYRRLLQTARLWEKGQSALWVDPDLSNALNWREAQAPTVAWAKRYGADEPRGEFELALRFLEESAAAVERKRLSEEARARERQELIERERELARDARAARILRGLALGLAVVCLTTLVVAVWAFIQKRTADTQTRLANARGLAAVGAGRLDVEPNLAAAFALRALESGTGEGEVLLRQALFRMPDRVFRGARPVEEMAFSTDGLRLAVAYEGGAVEVRDVTTGEARQVRGTAGSERVNAMTFVDGGRRLAVAIDRAGKGQVVLLDVAGQVAETDLPVSVAEQVCTRTDSGNSPLALALHPGGTWLASTWDNGQIVVWELSAEGSTPVAVSAGANCEPLSSVRFTEAGTELVGATADRRVLWWKTGEWSKPVRSIIIPGHTGTMNHLSAFEMDPAHPLGVVVLRRLGYSGRNGYIVSVISLEDGQHRRIIVQGMGELTGPLFSPDGNQIVTADAEGAIHVWDVATGERQRTLRGHTGKVNRLSVWGPSEAVVGRRATIVSGGDDGTARLWSLTPLSSRVLVGHDSQSSSVAFTPDGRRLVSGGLDGTVRLWDADRGREIRQIGKHGNDVYAVAVSPNGEFAASAGGTALSGSPTAKDRNIRMWDLAKGGPPLRMIAPPADVIGMAFSADGTVLATAGAEPAVRLWDVASGQQTAEMRWGEESGSMGLSFSQDGRFIVVAGVGAARVFDRAAGKELRVLKADKPAAPLSAAVFGANGRIVLTTSFGDPVITIWDANSGVKLRQFRGYTTSNGAALSVDGSLAVTADMGATARLWDVRTGTLLTGLIGAENAWSAVFANTATRIATTSGGGKIFVWDCEPCGALPDLVRLARERLKDALTDEQLRAVALQ